MTDHAFQMHPSEGRRSRFARPLKWLYVRLGCPRRWRVARVLIDVILRLEGGPCFSLTARELIAKYHDVRIGAYSYGPCMRVGEYPPGVTIGRYCSIGPGSRVFPQNHPLDRLSMHPFFYDRRLGLVPQDVLPPGKLTIEHDVWIGSQVIVTAGCRRIGIGAVIGAGAVVTKDVPDFAIVAGNPARVIRYRFDERTIELILKSRWWERPLSEVREHLPSMLAALGPTPEQHPLLVQAASAPAGAGAL